MTSGLIWTLRHHYGTVASISDTVTPRDRALVKALEVVLKGDGPGLSTDKLVLIPVLSSVPAWARCRRITATINYTFAFPVQKIGSSRPLSHVSWCCGRGQRNRGSQTSFWGGGCNGPLP